MKIGVNTRFLIKDKLEGIGWFTYETLKRITNNHPEHKFVFFFDRTYPKEFVFSENVKPVVLIPPARHPFLWYIYFEYSLKKALKKHHCDILLSTDGFLPLNTDIPTINVIHDINFHHRPDDLPRMVRRYYQKYFPHFAHQADRIVTVSGYSKTDIARSYKISPSKIDVVFNGANELYKPLKKGEIEDTKQYLTGGIDYFVFIGALHPRKNVSKLLKAFDKFRREFSKPFKMVIVGEKMFRTKQLESAYQQMEHRNDVIFTGRLSPEELRKILGSARALTFVPFFEGFGIPVVEAFYCDVPVIASNATSLPEVAGDAALYVNPYSTDSIKVAMLDIAKNESIRKQLIRNGQEQRKNFSWDLTAEKLWNSIEKVIA